MIAFLQAVTAMFLFGLGSVVFAVGTFLGRDWSGPWTRIGGFAAMAVGFVWILVLVD